MWGLCQVFIISLMLMHGMITVKILRFCSFLGLSIHKHAKILPNYDKAHTRAAKDYRAAAFWETEAFGLELMAPGLCFGLWLLS